MPKGIATEVIIRRIDPTLPIASGGIVNWMIVLSIVCRIGTPKNPIRLPTNITQNCWKGVKAIIAIPIKTNIVPSKNMLTLFFHSFFADDASAPATTANDIPAETSAISISVPL